MKTVLQFIFVFFVCLSSISQSAPELIFENPVLVSGIALKQGALYRFDNVKTGVDATIRLKKFSRSDISMSTVDNTVFGWQKAFQPEFGLPGNVAPNQNWFIDFEVTFYKAGTSIKEKLDTVDFTALDVDGDGVSISEYVTYDKPNSIVFATSTALTTSPAGLIGSLATCAEDDVTSAIIICTTCGGSGVVGVDEDPVCDGTGKLHASCMHSYQGGTGTNMQGPVTNFTNIDTSATLVMSVYRYLNRDKINFRYGARSGALSSAAGIRLNSMWFRRFNVNILNILASNVFEFKATLNNNQSQLKWNIMSEVNMYRYVVEKSKDGSNFYDIGSIIVENNNSNKKNYDYSDQIITSTKQLLYYRVRSEYQNGKIEYSNICIIKVGNQAETKLKLITYPNPVVNELRITIPEQWQNKKVVYEFFNSNGQCSGKKEINFSNQTEQINVNIFSTGVYFVRVRCNGETAQEKFIKN